jgi:hypothetical protein
MQIQKETGIGWRERIFICKVYRDESVNVRLDQEERKNVKTGGGVRQGCCDLLPILLNLYSEYLTTDALEGFGDFKKGPAIRTVK